MGFESFDVLIALLSGVCCLLSMGCMAVLVYLMWRRLGGGDASTSAHSGGGESVEAASAPVSSRGLPPAAESARLDDPDTRPTEVAPPRSRVALSDDVFDYDEDGPTTLFDPVELEKRLADADSDQGVPNLAMGQRLPAASRVVTPPSHRRAQLGQLELPPLGPLVSGATIVPPDDFDFIDDDDADETMLMARPPLPPKKK